MNNNAVIGIVGNPNCGKSTLFNHLTGGNQRVGNWPGVTVERKEGVLRAGGWNITVVDLPGVYTLAAQSPDERVAREFVLAGRFDLIVNIVDASNLERNLYLTVQLMEMRIPMLVVLNMMDVAREKEMLLDVPSLERMLGCPVVSVVAKRKEGMTDLVAALKKTLDRSVRPMPFVPPLPDVLVRAVGPLRRDVADAAFERNMDAGWIALKLIEGDAELSALFQGEGIEERVVQWRVSLERESGDEPDILVADARYRFIGEVMNGVVHRRGELSHALTERLDRWVLNRILGIPIFLGVLYLMFMFTINLGGVFIDFFDIVFGTLFVEGTRELLTRVGAAEWFITLLADGLGGSIQTLSTFIPPIGFMFLFLSWLEDSGYMARAAFILDRLLRFIGLPGKAFIPMMVGFGCNVPAIMGTRTLEHQRDRTLTIMMNPFMSCGARMPVYALFVAAFFPLGGQNVVFGLYLTGVMFAIFTGLTLRHTLLKGEPTPFVMELPLYHLPSLQTVMLHAWERLKGFITRAGRVLIPVIMALSFLNSLGTDGSFGNANTDKSVLSVVGRKITPVFDPMGIQEDNWPATVGLFIGVFAKEAVVGTLDAMYGQMSGRSGDAGGRAGFDPMARFGEAVTSITDKAGELGGRVLDPLGLAVQRYDSLEEAASAAKVSQGTFGAMAQLFDGRVGAIAYMLFVLLYFPCVAATSAIFQETGWRWTLFAGVWTTGLAWSAATVFYQLGTFARHPAISLAWAGVLVTVWVGVVALMRRLGRESSPASPTNLFMVCKEA
ncbi:MAG: Fe(2+) transporter permease subunit FeoB [Magnetococcales bacterium]|nr:Fe(2+) transporter permease subunit FeoB [Magnetococcales bacterium]MBF0149611.1 Fe(2+) transporter permease subunit FeoB [Magnetococcales bacterium]